jgi:hypothetical protein
MEWEQLSLTEKENKVKEYKKLWSCSKRCRWRCCKSSSHTHTGKKASECKFIFNKEPITIFADITKIIYPSDKIEITLDDQLKYISKYFKYFPIDEKNRWICCGSYDNKHFDWVAKLCPIIKNNSPIDNSTEKIKVYQWNNMSIDEQFNLIRSNLIIRHNYIKWHCCLNNSIGHENANCKVITNINPINIDIIRKSQYISSTKRTYFIM